MKYVYAIKFGKYVKIGLTANPAERLRALRWPVQLTPPDLDKSQREALCAFPGDYETERFLLGWLSEYRVEGEFFVLPEALVEKFRQHNSDYQRDYLFQLDARRRRKGKYYYGGFPRPVYERDPDAEYDF